MLSSSDEGGTRDRPISPRTAAYGVQHSIRDTLFVYKSWPGAANWTRRWDPGVTESRKRWPRREGKSQIVLA